MERHDTTEAGSAVAGSEATRLSARTRSRARADRIWTAASVAVLVPCCGGTGLAWAVALLGAGIVRLYAQLCLAAASMTHESNVAGVNGS